MIRLVVLLLAACSIVPDEIAFEVGQTYNRGDHLVGAWKPDRLDNANNENSIYAGFTVTYLIKPVDTAFSDIDRELLRSLAYKPPVEILFPPQDPVKTEPLPPNEEETPVDLLREGIEVIEETSATTFERIMWLLGAFIVLLVVVFGIKVVIKKKS